MSGSRIEGVPFPVTIHPRGKVCAGNFRVGGGSSPLGAWALLRAALTLVVCVGASHSLSPEQALATMSAGLKATLADQVDRRLKRDAKAKAKTAAEAARRKAAEARRRRAGPRGRCLAVMPPPPLPPDLLPLPSRSTLRATYDREEERVRGVPQGGVPGAHGAFAARVQTAEERARIEVQKGVKAVLDALRRSDRPLGPDDLRIQCRVDVAGDRPAGLRAALRSNPRIAHDDLSEAYTYRPKYDVTNKEALLLAVQRESARTAPGAQERAGVPEADRDKHRYGIPVLELQDSHTSSSQCQDDLEALARARKIYLIWSGRESCLVAFPRDLQTPYQPVECQLDEDMTALLEHALPMPRHTFDLEAELAASGIVPCTREANRPVQKRKADQDRKRKRAEAREARQRAQVITDPEPDPDGLL